MATFQHHVSLKWYSQESFLVRALGSFDTSTCWETCHCMQQELQSQRHRSQDQRLVLILLLETWEEEDEGWGPCRNSDPDHGCWSAAGCSPTTKTSIYRLWLIIYYADISPAEVFIFPVWPYTESENGAVEDNNKLILRCSAADYKLHLSFGDRHIIILHH